MLGHQSTLAVAWASRCCLLTECNDLLHRGWTWVEQAMDVGLGEHVDNAALVAGLELIGRAEALERQARRGFADAVNAELGPLSRLDWPNGIYSDCVVYHGDHMYRFQE